MDFLIKNKYYIIRTGDFAINANKKIIYSLLAFILCFEEYHNNGRYECLKIMTGSTIIWSIIEYLLYVTNTRIIKPMFINYGNYKIEIPKYLALLLQGLQEGGVVSTFGLYFGDRIYNYNYLILYNLFMLNMVINMNYKQTNTTILSKRQVNTFSSLVLMSIVTIYNISCLYRYPEHNLRSFKMCISMFYMSTIWTIMSYIKGFRKVSSLEYRNNNYYIGDNNKRDTLFILGYDVIFEICSAYLTFYNLFII
jgi:hypothetical protein